MTGSRLPAPGSRLVCAMAVMAASVTDWRRPAEGQESAPERCYRILDLGLIDEPASPPAGLGFGDIEKPIRINELGEVAFTAWDIGIRRAYLWLPAPNYGMPANARIDLGDLIPTDEPVAATDLNNALDGRLTIVGARATSGSGDNLPYAWQLQSGTTGLFAHGYLRDKISSPGGQLERPGFAYGVTDRGNDPLDLNPYIVGVTRSAPACLAGSTGPLDRAFRGQWNVGTYEELPPPPGFLPPVGPGGSSVALDVAKQGDPVAVGYAQQCDDATSTCVPTLTPMGWDVDPISDNDLEKTIAAQARGISYNGFNDSPDIVGFNRIDGFFCTQPGAFWDSLIDSFELLPYSVFENPHIVEGVSNYNETTEEVIAVGQNDLTDRALVWYGDNPSSWVVDDLNGALNSCCAGSSSWQQLINAIDVNENGHIVGYGLKGAFDPKLHYFLLIPTSSCTSCCGDTNDDGVVDVTDLLALLAAWGPCIGCHEDIDCDSDVGTPDLLILLAEWGPCGGQESAGLGMSLDEALETLGFSSVDELKTWTKTATTNEVHVLGELVHLFISPESGGGEE